MEFTNVMPYSEDNTDTLSGGIRQRVFFSMILAQDSRIIIMDEPVTYLDLEGKRTFFSMVNKLKKSGKTIILVLHDLSDAIRTVSYTHLRAHETEADLVCRLLL